MPYYLFLDDVRDPEDAFLYTGFSAFRDEKWLVVRSYDTFVEAINTLGLPQFISFDHDLGPRAYQTATASLIDYTTLGELTGYDCAKWLTNYCFDNSKPLPPFFVHSMNPVGKKNIQELLNHFKKRYED